jgi:hypothetical protein
MITGTRGTVGRRSRGRRAVGDFDGFGPSYFLPKAAEWQKRGEIHSIQEERDRETERQPDMETERQRDRETDRQTDRHTDIQTGRQTDRQTDKQTNRQTERQSRR